MTPSPLNTRAGSYLKVPALALASNNCRQNWFQTPECLTRLEQVLNTVEQANSRQNQSKTARLDMNEFHSTKPQLMLGFIA